MASRRSKYLFLLCVLSLSGTDACRPEDVEVSNLRECLQNITSAFTDVNRFWFGDDYDSICGGNEPDPNDCFANAESPDSLSNLLSVNFDSDDVITYLEVTFTSVAGSYTGCGHTFTSTTDEEFSVYPLSTQTRKSWKVRDTPEVTWSAEPDTQYSLVVTEAGSGSIRALYVNANDGTLENAEVVVPYDGVLSIRRFPTPYVFLLYEQTTTIDLDSLNDAQKSNLGDFLSTQGFLGPRGINWMLVTYDAYSLESKRDVVERCSLVVTDALRQEDLAFLDTDALTSPLAAFADVSITSPGDIDTTFCCQQISIPMSTTVLDPLGNSVLSPAVVRSDSSIAITLSKTDVLGDCCEDFEDALYTVLSVDPDIPSQFSTAGTESRPLLHWLTSDTRIDEDGVLSAGNNERPYRGPRPPKLEPPVHTYYFLVYRQPALYQTPVNSTTHSGATCVSRIEGRCLFDVAGFVQDKGLALVAASWLRAENDLWTQRERAVPQSEACHGQPGYQDPCPVVESTTANSGSVGLMVPAPGQGILMFWAGLSVLWWLIL